MHFEQRLESIVLIEIVGLLSNKNYHRFLTIKTLIEYHRSLQPKSDVRYNYIIQSVELIKSHFCFAVSIQHVCKLPSQNDTSADSIQAVKQRYFKAWFDQHHHHDYVCVRNEFQCESITHQWVIKMAIFNSLREKKITKTITNNCKFQQFEYDINVN